MRTPRAVQAEMLAIAPEGFAWPEGDADSFTAAKWLALANEISLVEGRCEAMLPQIDPRTAPDLLSDYQRVLGPDPCGRDQLALSFADQAALAWQRWTGAPGAYPGWFIAAAAAIGVTMTITEYPQSMCGASVCGDSLVPSPQQCSFLVGLPATRVTQAVCGAAQCGDLIGAFTPNLMECVVRAFAPLHTQPYFAYH